MIRETSFRPTHLSTNIAIKDKLHLHFSIPFLRRTFPLLSPTLLPFRQMLHPRHRRRLPLLAILRPLAYLGHIPACLTNQLPPIKSSSSLSSSSSSYHSSIQTHLCTATVLVCHTDIRISACVHFSSFISLTLNIT